MLPYFLEKFEHMTDGRKDIESNLHSHLTEHLNAEIVLGTITDLDVAMRWLSGTFLYIRARQNPRHYGIPLGLTSDKIDKKLLEICQIDLNKLVKGEMATMDEDINIHPTNLGELMAKYYMSFETIKLFKTLTGNEILQQILSTISKCQEFSDMRLRVDEKKCLNLLNKNRNKDSIRFPFSGKIKTIDMKINCTIQAIFGCLEIEDHSILSEAFRIMRLGERICRCLIEYWKSKTKCYSALVNTIVLWKCFRAQLWENSPHVAKQFPGIGLITSNLLMSAGKTSLIKIINTNPREIEMITKKKPPFGNKIIDIAKTIPRYDMQMEKFNQDGQCKLKIVLNLLNPECLQETPVVDTNDIMSLLIGDNHNNILLYERYMHSHMLENNRVVKLITVKEDVDEVRSHFISENFVGIDLSESITIKLIQLEPEKNANKKILEVRKNKAQETPYKKLDDKYAKFVQTYIDNYLRCKKSNSKSTDRDFCKPDISKLGSESELNDSKKDPSNPTLKESLNIANTAEVVGNEEGNHDSDKHIFFGHSEPEARNISRSTNHYYNLSSYDEGDEIKEINRKAEGISNKTSQTFVRALSLTDEEIAQHVDGILTENLKDDNTGHPDLAEKFGNLYEDDDSSKVQVDKEIVNLDLAKEFPSLCDKYGKKNSSENAEENTESSSYANFPRCMELSNSNKRLKRTEKLHSAESFEDALFNPNTDSLNAYRYKPTKRLSHCNSEVEHPFISQSKRRKSESVKDKMSEDMMKNLDKYIESSEKESPYAKSIKWRSPLVYSPPVKYSPKISTSFSFTIPMPKSNEFESSHDWSIGTDDTNTSRNFRTSSSGITPIRKNSWGKPKQSSKFLLADKEYENDASSEKNDTLNQTQNTVTMNTPRKSLQLQDIISSSFLEDVGLTKSPRVTTKLENFSQKPKSKNDLEMTVGAYYHDLIAKNRHVQTNSTDQPQQNLEARAPFFLNQNIAKPNENAPKREMFSCNQEIDPRINYSINPTLFQNQGGGLTHSQNYYQSLQHNAGFFPPDNVNKYYPRDALESNMPQYYNIPPNFQVHSRYGGDVGPLLPVNANNHLAYPPIRNYDHRAYSGNSTNQIRYAVEANSRPDFERSFYEARNFSAQKDISAQLSSNDFSNINQRLPQGVFHPQPQYKCSTLDVLDQNVATARKSEYLNNSFCSPNSINFSTTGSKQNHELGKLNNFVDDSKRQNYEKENLHHSAYSWKNIDLENPQNTLESRGQDGFFLNANQSVYGPQRYTDEMFHTWNNVCSQHRLFNCPVCTSQSIPFSLNTSAQHRESIHDVGSKITNDSDQIILQSHPSFECHESRAKTSSSQLGYQYNDRNNFYQSLRYNEPHLSQINQRVATSDRSRANSHLTNIDSVQDDSRFFLRDNSLLSQGNPHFPRDIRAGVDIPKQQNEDVQVGKKAFILDKFLQSCENPQ